MPELELRNAQVLYDGVVEAIRDVSLRVPAGQTVALLGSNGAGKTTLLKAISGVLAPEKGFLTNGTIKFGTEDVSKMNSELVVRSGIVQVPEARRLFVSLTVEENLIVGGAIRSRTERKSGLERVYELFPEIHSHRHRVAGYLSGGQQQMVALGRALMSRPQLLMLDEPSLGLAPRVISQIFDSIVRLRTEQGIGILLVEQNARLALEIADYGYVLERGRVVFDGDAPTLRASSEIQEFYLGIHEGSERRSMRDVKHYKRRKRWLS